MTVDAFIPPALSAAETIEMGKLAESAGIREAARFDRMFSDACLIRLG